MKQIAEHGKVLQMQSFSVHDGDGIRTVIFLYGCPLRCKWCANPDSWATSPSDLRETALSEVIRKVSRDEVFYRFSNGGVTFSGGEPTAQPEFLRGMVQALDKRGVDMWIETCGEFEWSRVEDIFPYFSHVFFDLKCMDTRIHMELTGVHNERILENAVRIHELGLPMTIRIPSLKGVNFTDRNLRQTADFMKTYLPSADLELLPYHNLGKEKYIAMGMEHLFTEYETPDQAEIKAAETMLTALDIPVISYK